MRYVSGRGADRSVGIGATLDVPRNLARGISESPSFRNGTSPAIIRGVRDIDLKTLRLFVAVSDCRSMARAAEQEHIEPSAISKRIAQLEEDLGVELLVRGRRGVQTTPAGLALLEHARSVLFTMDRIVADAASFAGGVQGHVRLIATASAIADALLDDIASFMREPDNRNIKVDIEERLSRDLVREVRDGNASLGVCWDQVDFEGLAQRRVPARPARARRLRRPRAGRPRVGALRGDARLRARRPAADDGGAHDAAARRRAGRANGVVPRHRLRPRRGAARRRRQPRRQRRAARDRPARRGRCRHRPGSDRRRLGRAQLRDLLSRLRRAAGQPAPRRPPRARPSLRGAGARTSIAGRGSSGDDHGGETAAHAERAGDQRLADESMPARSPRGDRPSGRAGRHRAD